MRRDHLEDMVRGWFVGDFAPAAHRTPAAEVGVKRYAAGDHEPRHHHRRATEITLILEGRVEMNGHRYGAGEIVVLDPGEPTDFRALTPATTVVVKVPSVPGDKYPGGP
jgi:quercetin dioxygenase-like cupin family protein